MRLAPGRYCKTWPAVRATWGNTAHRAELLDQVDVFLGLVQRVTPVCAVWLSGSFLTEKQQPRDIDIVLLIDELAINNITGAGARRLVTTEGLRELADRRKLQIDAYILQWRARPALHPDAQDQKYLQDRGYWDDFWQRSRTTADGAQPVREDALPRRGYVEVIVDGFK